MSEIDFSIERLSESAIVISFGKQIHPRILQKVRSLSNYIEEHRFQGFIELVPSFASVTIFFDPMKIKMTAVRVLLEETVKGLKLEHQVERREIVIPVCYGGELGPDLTLVAKHNHLTAEEVIEIHSNSSYLVYMIGFAPGFPYLGGLSERIHTPRKEVPRLGMPAGSVGIGGSQTGIYPISTPGGWQIIGKTPFELFRPHHQFPSLLQAGDTVRFQPISRERYEEYKEERG
ncbi:5-oxoprolinase subunit PxpB [Halalkalibacter krulwichiae]|uniref:Kinase A inhibitor n=1 Tax=Halalkalibacter krulwichiae TaxID=199441 RepID=A0A1Y9THD0_9BACI|nr:5-oxoprolinase subunit PxpB [Halalkalibacter krulwichiae]ARK28589.1 Kinase A inhibitor [Halalkalibacter krulwichiae]